MFPVFLIRFEPDIEVFLGLGEASLLPPRMKPPPSLQHLPHNCFVHLLIFGLGSYDSSGNLCTLTITKMMQS